MFEKLSALFSRGSVVTGGADPGDHLGHDTSGKPGSPAQRSSGFIHTFPADSPWSAGSFGSPDEVQTGALQKTAALFRGGLQAELGELFAARHTAASGAIPHFSDVPAGYSGNQPVRLCTDRELMVMNHNDALSARGDERRNTGIRLVERAGESGQPYTLFENGREVTDSQDARAACEYLRSCLVLPEARLEALTPTVAAANRAFQREAADLYAKRYEASPNIVPQRGAEVSKDAMVRYVDEEQSALLIQTQEQFRLYQSDKGLMLCRLPDGSFEIYRDNQKLTNAGDRHVALREIRDCLGLPQPRKLPARVGDVLLRSTPAGDKNPLR